MCWDDQKKARTLQTRPHAIAAGASVTLPPNPGRVRLVVSPTASGGGSVVVTVGGRPTLPLALSSEATPTIVMRIEDYGQALTGDLTVDAALSANPVAAHETIINEEYP